MIPLVPKRTFFKTILALGSILIGLIYILNPGFGLFELIPDSIPVIGNLDEAGAVLLILSGLRYLGLDLTRYFNLKKNASPSPPPNEKL